MLVLRILHVGIWLIESGVLAKYSTLHVNQTLCVQNMHCTGLRTHTHDQRLNNKKKTLGLQMDMRYFARAGSGQSETHTTERMTKWLQAVICADSCCYYCVCPSMTIDRWVFYVSCSLRLVGTAHPLKQDIG